ncbi:hypothetical protein DTO006G1_6569 [Penicillium roqueforti]|uniref:uncharacterized protein n=1 Tax=Penicillium roqueforti TaxID=5082 RepID=UPI00190DA3C8|nr:uncharacterized protein LCP9604111_6997 [Penicillium roqueforti]KAF9245139.1 hypothetical protein LCP9604111_6997 [Penicillium roqueforti]KAI1833256.1 hypothetical protein CBS147337_5754 [Penicillium roqueforti]KAI2671195.1 hypothetical protein CBS147355_8789 [Penicillium roqueforti]KAI2695708.1 hypothetical protein CBS147372_8971 [Penicillium roqueforti]KAI2709964.1 hypothetical protein CBS147318_8823 [Penicillium roqueforti]
MSTPTSEAGSQARTPRRPAARGKWSEEQLLTSDKSLLIDMDLVKLLARPEAWNCLEESEKREILSLLPPDVHPEAEAISDDPNAKIKPIPDSFLRYSNNWRDGIRQFQLDLQHGRYDPQWLREAQEAKQEREDGDFDDFKEREYEEFWGQKQKVNWYAMAGESASVRLGTLIDEGVIQPGDIWKFYHIFGRGSGRIIIEKEVMVLDCVGPRLTFAIPPGERVFLRSNFDKAGSFSIPEKGKEDMKVDIDTQLQPSQATHATSDGEEIKVDTGKAPHEVFTSSTEINSDTDTATGTQPVISPSNNEESQQDTPFSVVIFSPGGTRNRKPKRTIPEPEPQPPVKKRGRPRKTQPKQSEPPSQKVEVPQEIEVSQRDEQNTTDSFSVMRILTAKIAENNRAAAESSPQKPSWAESPFSVLSSTSEPSELLGPHLSTHIEAPAEAERDEINKPPNTEQQKDPVPIPPPTTDSEPDEIIVPNIPSPGALVLKILQIDGRKPTSRTGNAWKSLRCYRNNQDMGSLFDVREAWFLQHGQPR